MVRLAGLKHPTTMYTAGSAFDLGVTRLLSSGKVSAMSDEMRTDLKDRLESMRRKLRFGPAMVTHKPVVLASSRQIEIGGKVFVTKLGGYEFVEATVLGNTAAELLIVTGVAMEGEPGDRWTVRHALDNTAWEFDTKVIRNDEGKAALEHSRETRRINSRRFQRVRTHKSAAVAAFPFHCEPDFKSPEFLPATVVEMAAGSLLIESPLELSAGDTVLVTIEMTGEKRIQNVAKVRRIASERPDGPFAVVDLFGLARKELAVLVRETNLAAVET